MSTLLTLFSSIFFFKIDIVVLSFVFNKYCLIIDELGSEDSSRKLQVNCIINYFFYLYLMLRIFVSRFDLTRNLKNFTKSFETKQGQLR